MGEILRNLGRRKARSALSILGILVGVFALTVMGSMSEYYHTILDNALRMAGSVIDVWPASRDLDRRLNQGMVRRLRNLDGVKEAMPVAIDTLGVPSQVSFSPPELVMGIEPEQLSFFLPGVALDGGRWLQPGDRRAGVVGADLALRRGLRVGSEVEWRDKAIEVVGLLEITRSTPDWFVYVPLETVRSIAKDPDLLTAIRVIPADAGEAEELTRRIEAELSHVRARSPRQSQGDARQSLAVFEVIMLSGALIAAIVGGLSVTNTMIQSVHERTREIGIKKAVGATTLHIVAEYVGEALVMSAIGGAIGLLLGWQAVGLLNREVAAPLGAAELWLLTPRLAVGALLFALLLGGLAGFYPAWRAARLDPVTALRWE